MYINARNPEEVRIAIVNKEKMVTDVIYEHPGQDLKKGNIYKAVVTHREESLNAIFVRYNEQGLSRDGFLPKGEILPEYFNNPDGKSIEQLSVKDIPEGKEIIVQVDKEERGTKGAALTTYISLAGCYLVLMPKNPQAGGISRRIEGDDRNDLREILAQLRIPPDAGVIIRTAGVGKSYEELQWDLDVLLRVWQAIADLAEQKSAPFLIHQESDAIGRAVRDYLRQGITEILVDTDEAWQRAQHYVTQLKPDFVQNVKLYSDIIPLFNRYHIETQLEAAFQRQVKLHSGGNIVIDHTEALVSIDVNSAKATRAKDIEETAFQTNVESANEIARQLRLRDMNGIIVIDFIDMANPAHQREVENILREAVKPDRARIQIGRISKFGILEMSRQRLRPSLRESSSVLCPRCQGQGRIRAIESLALAILRLVREEAINKRIIQIEAQLPTAVATYLLNEKRNDLYEIESVYQTRVLLIPNEFIETPNYRIRGITKEQLQEHGLQASYRMVERVTEDYSNEPHSVAMSQSEPALKTVSLNLPMPPRAKPNLLKRLWENIFGEQVPPSTPVSQRPASAAEPLPGRESRPRGSSHSGDGHRGGRDGHRPGYRSQNRSQEGSYDRASGERRHTNPNRRSNNRRGSTGRRPTQQQQPHATTPLIPSTPPMPDTLVTLEPIPPVAAFEAAAFAAQPASISHAQFRDFPAEAARSDVNQSEESNRIEEGNRAVLMDNDGRPKHRRYPRGHHHRHHRQHGGRPQGSRAPAQNPSEGAPVSSASQPSNDDHD